MSQIQVFRLSAISNRSQFFELRLKKLLRRRQPQNALIRIILAELEPDEGFPGTGRMNDSRLASLSEHGNGRIVRRMIMLEKLHCRTDRPSS